MDDLTFDPMAPPDLDETVDFSFDPAEVSLPWDAEGNITILDGVEGTPAEDAAHWEQQSTGFTCAVVAQLGIIETFTGQEITEAELVYDATVNGWLTDGGTDPEHVGHLLELYGVDCHSIIGATVDDLVSELAQGHKVIVAVDSGEMWADDVAFEDFIQGQAADHAIWVTGVDFSDPDNPMVIVNDSGDAEGAGKTYALSIFVDAWQDSGFHMVATDDAPPGYAVAGFDPDQGWFPELVDYFRQHDADFGEISDRNAALGSSGNIYLEDSHATYTENDFIVSSDGTHYLTTSDFVSGTGGYTLSGSRLDSLDDAERNALLRGI